MLSKMKEILQTCAQENVVKQCGKEPSNVFKKHVAICIEKYFNKN